MGKYKYESRKVKRLAYVMRFFLIPWWVFWLLFYFFAVEESADRLFPPFARPYVFAFFLILGVGSFWYGSSRLLRRPQIDGLLWIDEGKLRMKVLRGSRAEQIELELHTVSFLVNDEEELQLSSPKGTYTFDCAGFPSKAIYEQFRKDITCEKYKE